jgi:acetyl-CoA carboxylase biotin carboxyl carrier protein
MLVKSTITGSVREVLVEVGQEVQEGDELLVIESMKMEIPVEAPCAGRIVQVLVQPGLVVGEGDPLAEVG